MSEFMEFLNTKTWSRPEEGHHTFQITGYVVPKDGNYVRVTGTLDNTRPFTINLFELDVRFAISAIRAHNKDIDGATPLDIFKYAEKNQLQLDIWLAFPTVMTKRGEQQVTNIYWREPANNTTITDTSEVEGLE